MDIDLPLIEKIIILKYRSTNFKSVLIEFGYKLNKLPKQWSFGRTISFSVRMDGDCMVFEFRNVGTFISVNLMKEWFEGIIRNFEVKSFETLSFVSGSYHFLNKIHLNPMVTVYCFGVDDNDIVTVSRSNPNIDGIPIKLSKVHHSVRSENIHNQNTVKLFLWFLFLNQA